MSRQSISQNYSKKIYFIECGILGIFGPYNSLSTSQNKKLNGTIITYTLDKDLNYIRSVK